MAHVVARFHLFSYFCLVIRQQDFLELSDLPEPFSGWIPPTKTTDPPPLVCPPITPRISTPFLARHLHTSASPIPESPTPQKVAAAASHNSRTSAPLRQGRAYSLGDGRLRPLRGGAARRPRSRRQPQGCRCPPAILHPPRRRRHGSASLRERRLRPLQLPPLRRAADTLDRRRHPCASLALLGRGSHSFTSELILSNPRRILE